MNNKYTQFYLDCCNGNGKMRNIQRLDGGIKRINNKYWN